MPVQTIIQTKMSKVVTYVKESYDELVNKVSWPTWSELTSSAIIVLIASLLIALVVFLMDTGFKYVLEQVYNNLFQ